MIELTNIIKELKKEKKIKLSLFKLTHEIKNPIAVCKGYLKMLDYDKEEKLKKYIPIIDSEINRTLNIINDFSDYGKMRIEKDIVDLVMLIEDIYSTFAFLLEKNKMALNINCDEEEIYIELDYNRIKQVLINVLKNSLEAKKDDEKLIIDFDVKTTKNFVKIVIKDNGIGMSAETLDKMSDIFYTTKSTGTGLGVALSREIVELHGGSMNYKSVLGKGTTVTIKLPLK